ncbi:uncharacterized protein LOC128243103 isoform X3 [Mya arenaria]|uniref:uncharacterized protein LOC128243103 isoform X3 n=1 Tax=Mya arenaria TaxID=6604 RepID=UPI0022E606D3|nr:uncharacterized protein LOC128243103 isoform X3 [Mya arenaria]
MWVDPIQPLNRGQGTLQASHQRDDLSHAMFIFQLLQKGMIFTALVVGVICCGHLVFVRRKYCRNTTTLLAVVLPGFFHLIACVKVLIIAEKNTVIRGKEGTPSVGLCLDYLMTAVCANTVVIVVIIHNIFVKNFKWSVSSCLAYAGILSCIITGSFFVINRVPQYSSLQVAQHSPVTLGTPGNQHIEVFLSVCQKNVYEERWAILAEYLLIYIPVIVTVLAALCMNKTKQTECQPAVEILYIAEEDSPANITVCSIIGKGQIDDFLDMDESHFLQGLSSIENKNKTF